MIKFTMGASDNKKTHRRKLKRTSKSGIFSSTSRTGGIRHPKQGSVSEQTVPSTVVKTSHCANELDTMYQLSQYKEGGIHFGDGSQPIDGCTGGAISGSVSAPLKPVLGNLRCLLCQCHRSESSRVCQNNTDENKLETAANSQVTLWICKNCRHAIEEEEAKKIIALQQSVFAPPTHTSSVPSANSSSALITAAGSMTSAAAASDSCSCSSCLERRQLQAELHESSFHNRCLYEMREFIHNMFMSHEYGPHNNKDKEKVSHIDQDACRCHHNNISSQTTVIQHGSTAKNNTLDSTNSAAHPSNLNSTNSTEISPGSKDASRSKQCVKSEKLSSSSTSKIHCDKTSSRVSPKSPKQICDKSSGEGTNLPHAAAKSDSSAERTRTKNESCGGDGGDDRESTGSRNSADSGMEDSVGFENLSPGKSEKSECSELLDCDDLVNEKSDAVSRGAERVSGKGVGGAEREGAEYSGANDDRIREHVARLCSGDPQELFHLLDIQLNQYVVKCGERLMNCLPGCNNSSQRQSGQNNEKQPSAPNQGDVSQESNPGVEVHKDEGAVSGVGIENGGKENGLSDEQVLSMEQAVQKFMSALLNEYWSMLDIAYRLSAFLGPLETEHLSKFGLTIVGLHRLHFYEIIYAKLQPHVEMFESLLGSTSEGQGETLMRFKELQVEMNDIAKISQHCQELIIKYSSEQANARAAESLMIDEDWTTDADNSAQAASSGRRLKDVMLESMWPMIRDRAIAINSHQAPDTCQGFDSNCCPCEECSWARMLTEGLSFADISDGATGQQYLDNYSEALSQYRDTRLVSEYRLVQPEGVYMPTYDNQCRYNDKEIIAEEYDDEYEMNHSSFPPASKYPHICPVPSSASSSQSSLTSFELQHTTTVEKIIEPLRSSSLTPGKNLLAPGDKNDKNVRSTQSSPGGRVTGPRWKSGKPKLWNYPFTTAGTGRGDGIDGRSLMSSPEAPGYRRRERMTEDEYQSHSMILKLSNSAAARDDISDGNEGDVEDDDDDDYGDDDDDQYEDVDDDDDVAQETENFTERSQQKVFKQTAARKQVFEGQTAAHHYDASCSCTMCRAYLQQQQQLYWKQLLDWQQWHPDQAVMFPGDISQQLQGLQISPQYIQQTVNSSVERLNLLSGSDGKALHEENIASNQRLVIVNTAQPMTTNMVPVTSSAGIRKSVTSVNNVPSSQNNSATTQFSPGFVAPGSFANIRFSSFTDPTASTTATAFSSVRNSNPSKIQGVNAGAKVATPFVVPPVSSSSGNFEPIQLQEKGNLLSSSIINPSTDTKQAAVIAQGAAGVPMFLSFNPEAAAVKEGANVALLQPTVLKFPTAQVNMALTNPAVTQFNGNICGVQMQAGNMSYAMPVSFTSAFQPVFYQPNIVTQAQTTSIQYPLITSPFSASMVNTSVSTGIPVLFNSPHNISSPGLVTPMFGVNNNLLSQNPGAAFNSFGGQKLSGEDGISCVGQNQSFGVNSSTTQPSLAGITFTSPLLPATTAATANTSRPATAAAANSSRPVTAAANTALKQQPQQIKTATTDGPAVGMSHQNGCQKMAPSRIAGNTAESSGMNIAAVVSKSDLGVMTSHAAEGSKGHGQGCPGHGHGHGVERWDGEHYVDDDDDEDDDDDDEDCSSDEGESSNASPVPKGKYCECWHCEFFGHSMPPSAPMSKNYAEIRDRLRLRLSKKKGDGADTPCESMAPVGPTTTCTNQHTMLQHSDIHHAAPHNKNSSCIYQQSNQPVVHQLAPRNMPNSAGVKSEPLVERSLSRENYDVDEVLKFINGETRPDAGTKSSKAAKRARQKQKKELEKCDEVQAKQKESTTSTTKSSAQVSNSNTQPNKKSEQENGARSKSRNKTEGKRVEHETMTRQNNEREAVKTKKQELSMFSGKDQSEEKKKASQDSSLDGLDIDTIDFLNGASALLKSELARNPALQQLMVQAASQQQLHRRQQQQQKLQQPVQIDQKQMQERLQQRLRQQLDQHVATEHIQLQQELAKQSQLGKPQQLTAEQAQRLMINQQAQQQQQLAKQQAQQQQQLTQQQAQQKQLTLQQAQQQQLVKQQAQQQQFAKQQAQQKQLAQQQAQQKQLAQQQAQQVMNQQNQQQQLAKQQAQQQQMMKQSQPVKQQTNQQSQQTLQQTIPPQQLKQQGQSQQNQQQPKQQPQAANSATGNAKGKMTDTQEKQLMQNLQAMKLTNQKQVSKPSDKKEIEKQIANQKGSDKQVVNQKDASISKNSEPISKNVKAADFKRGEMPQSNAATKAKPTNDAGMKVSGVTNAGTGGLNDKVIKSTQNGSNSSSIQTSKNKVVENGAKTAEVSKGKVSSGGNGTMNGGDTKKNEIKNSGTKIVINSSVVSAEQQVNQCKLNEKTSIIVMNGAATSGEMKIQNNPAIKTKPDGKTENNVQLPGGKSATTNTSRVNSNTKPDANQKTAAGKTQNEMLTKNKPIVTGNTASDMESLKAGAMNKNSIQFKNEKFFPSAVSQPGQVGSTNTVREAGQNVMKDSILVNGALAGDTVINQTSAAESNHENQKIKKNKKKNKGKESSVDDIFLPRTSEGNTVMEDGVEREIEEFKRFCFNSTVAGNREKLQVNVNLKDMFVKKK